MCLCGFLHDHMFVQFSARSCAREVLEQFSDDVFVSVLTVYSVRAVF
jgi:hypothetical protein